MREREKVILNFIKEFNINNSVEELFTNKCCYWFAKILQDRFYSYNPIIVYDPNTCHFAVNILDSFYDITGKLSYNEDFIEWNVYEEIDSLDYSFVYDMCVRLEEH